MTRKVGERIMIGDNVVVTVVKIAGGMVRIGIEAPASHTVVRRELLNDSNARQSGSGSNSQAASE